MRKSVIMLALALATVVVSACAGTKKEQQKQPEVMKDTKTLVAYFSCTGNTEAVAKMIAEEEGATLYRIEPEQPYTAADLDWEDKSSRSTIEMNDSTSRPAIKATLKDADRYDTIFLGYPIWWDQAPRVINSFIEQYKFAGKRVIPFATSGGSSIDNSERLLKAQYPDIRWESGRLLNDATDREIDAWLQ